MRHYLKIYHKRSHLLVAISVIALPFLFILLVLPLTNIDKTEFLGDLLISSLRLLAAFFFSVLLALVLAMGLSRGRKGEFFLPVFDVLQSFPTFAMLPLVIHWFGAGTFTVVIFLIVTMVWPMLFAIISSLKLVRGDWEEAATIFGAKGWRRVLYFALPLAYPGLVTGAIVGLGEGWEAVVGAEIIVGLQAGGLGSFFSKNGSSESLVLFGVLALLLFIFSLNKLVWLPLLEKSHKLLTE